MHRHDPPEARVGEPLAGWAAGFAAYLTSCGYSWASAKHHLRLMADLSAWLGGQGLTAGDLTPPVVGRFRGALRARRSYLVRAASVEPLLGYLRSLGVLPSRAADGPAEGAGVLLRDYERYLRG